MKKKRILKVLLVIALAIIAYLLWANYSAKKETEKPLSSYKVLQLKKGSGSTNMEFVSTVQSAQVVEIRPRVEGYVDQIFVREGARVKKGEPLFKINADTYEQAFTGAKADVLAAQANLDNARLEVEKTIPLVEQDIVSPFQLETARSNQQAAQAKLEQARANMEQSRINLGYTLITSPVDGVVSQIPLRVGSLVKVSDTRPMTTVASDGDVFAYFSISEKLMLRGMLTNDTVTSNNMTIKGKALLMLSDGSTYDHPGKLELASGIVDKQTGSLLLKAVFPNPDRRLTTGLSGVIQIPQRFDDIISIPQSSTYELQDKKMVKVIDKDGVVQSREIGVVGADGKDYLVNFGLEVGDLLLVQGVNIVRDGQKIIPEVVTSF